MKKLLYILFACVLMVSCELETSGNDELDGFWQWTAVDTLETEVTKDMRESKIFWAVQGKLLEVRQQIDQERQGDCIFFRFEWKNEWNEKTLRLYSPCRDERHAPDEPIEDVELLKPYGIYHLEETFLIEALDYDDMVLSNGVLRLHFRKY